MGIYIREFKKTDLKAFEPIETGVSSYDNEFAQAIEDSDLAVTGIKNGEIVLCGGVHPTENPEHGELWLRLSRGCQKNKIETIRCLKEGLRIISDVFPFRQLNAIIKCDFAQSIRLIEFLGFSKTQELVFEGQKWSIFSKRVKE